MARKRLPLLRFGGELDKPLRLVPRTEAARSATAAISAFRAPSVGSGKSSVAIREAFQFLAVAFMRRQAVERKLELLMQYFNIDPEGAQADRELAIKLAELCVRGFQDQVAPGAPTRWGHAQLSALKACVNTLVAEGHSARRACEILFSKQSSDFGFPRCNSVGTMYRRYHQAKKAK